MEKSDYVLMERPDGDTTVQPSANAEHYVAKGFKIIGPAPGPGEGPLEETKSAAPQAKPSSSATPSKAP